MLTVAAQWAWAEFYLSDPPTVRRIITRGAARRSNRITWRLS